VINAAIVGLGWWGKTLVDAVQGKSDKIRFVAGHNRTRAKAEEYCKARGIALHDELASILADPKIDAVVHAARHSERDDQARRTAAAGKHVFVEKPFALDLKSAESALEAAAKAKVVIGVGYQRRFHPSTVELRNRIRDGRMGTVSQCIGESTAHPGLTLPKESWRVDPAEAPAGGMTALGVHALDAMVEFFGPVAEVYCMNSRRASPVIDDTTTVLMRHRDGVSSTIVCSMISAPNYRLAVYGAKGYAEISKPTLETFRFVPTPHAAMAGQPSATEPESIEAKGFDPVRAELEAFATSIEAGTPFPNTPEQIRAVVAAFEAIVRSAAIGQPVKIG
jgi:predicted dehydrogenase